MGIFLIIIASLMWSFVGIFVKTASLAVDSSTITFSRFFFGVLFLGLFLLVKEKKIKINWKSKWIWIAAAGKCCNYIFENLGISIGYAYGNVLVMPMSTLFLVLISTLYLKEKISPKGWLAIFFCLTGIFLICWNGLPLSVFINDSIVTTLLFTLSAVGIAFHLLGQKMLLPTMDSGTMNLSIFFWCSWITILPLPFTFHWNGPFDIRVLGALMGLGFITGISFYINAIGMKKVPFLAAVILGNSNVLLSLVWARLFFHEPITPYIVSGAVLFLIGIVLQNLENASKRRAYATNKSSVAQLPNCIFQKQKTGEG